MSTELALLRAIRDLPDEDTPRLVYADYLDDVDEHARAEFIRVQIERARTPEADPRRRELEDREHELLCEHEGAFLGVAPGDFDGLTEWQFDRGFVHEVAASPTFMLGAGTQLANAHPVRRWRVQSGQNEFPEDLKEAGQRGWFARLDALDLSGWYTSLGELGGFLYRSQFERLRELDLSHRPGLEALPEILEAAPFRDQLKALLCGGGNQYEEDGRLGAITLAQAMGRACKLTEFGAGGAMLTAEDVRDILIADFAHELTDFDVRANQLAPDGWDAFVGARCRLHELDVSNTPLGAISLDRLLACKSLSQLKRLHMNGCGSAMANMAALAASPFWAQAEELRMQNGTIPEASLDPLFNSSGPKALRVLDVGENYVRTAGVARLCAANWSHALTYLDLSRNYLTDDALRMIAGCDKFAHLRTLHLNYNSPYHLEGAEHTEAVTDAGLRALADSPHLRSLRVLSLSGTRITASGIEAVLNSPYFRLTGLSVANCQLRSAAMDVIAGSPRTARLEVLDLSGNDEFGSGELRALAESEYLSPMTELDVRGTSAGDTTVYDALRERVGCRLGV
jgi:uncharacterized protein (TIGR02996 family)